MSKRMKMTTTTGGHSRCRSKRRKVTSTSSSTPTGAKPSGWSNLPDDLLHCILMRLLDFIGDFLSFSKVCKQWRQAAHDIKKDYMALRPPMLIILKEPGLLGFGSIINPEFHREVQVRTISKLYLGFSFGHMIMVDASSRRRPSLMNPLSGKTIVFPKLPASSMMRIGVAVLSAPPESKNCVLLCWGSDEDEDEDATLAICRLEDKNWIEEPWSHSQARHGIGINVNSRINVSRVFVVTSACKLVMIDLILQPRNILLEVTSVGLPPGHLTRDVKVFELGGKVLWANKSLGRCYKMVDGVWKRVKSLGQNSVFMTLRGCMVCANTAAWGGRENSIYYVDYGDSASVIVLSLKDQKRELLLDSFPWLPRMPLSYYIWI